jgi:diguanylate cyclase (GGDEF)-like protein
MHLTATATGGESPVRRPPRRPGQWAWAGAVVVLLLAVFGLDRLTDAAPVQHLYYLPIIIAAARFGRAGAVIAALAAIGAYHAANPGLVRFEYGQADIVQVVLFLGVGATAAKLISDARRLRRMAMSDDLTGLHNLRSFEAVLATMIRAARHQRQPLSLLVLDLDRLKALNDEYGHLAGAEAVRTVGQILARHLPADAAACRYGGDEFVVALPGQNRQRAGEVADLLRQAVHDAAPVLAGLPFPAGTLSISIGLASRSFPGPPGRRDAPGDGDAGEALFRAADQALYLSKARGRNCVSVARA